MPVSRGFVSQILEPGTANAVDLDRLKQVSDSRDQNAEANARKQASERRDNRTGVNGVLIEHGHSSLRATLLENDCSVYLNVMDISFDNSGQL